MKMDSELYKTSKSHIYFHNCQAAPRYHSYSLWKDPGQ